ncbi:hypothetical protein EGW08_012074, partial [Elysia chlorotica]
DPGTGQQFLVERAASSGELRADSSNDIEARPALLEEDASASRTRRVTSCPDPAHPGGSQQEGGAKAARGGASSAALNKILDPMWAPDSGTPMDVSSAVRYILLKRPDSESFPLAREIFDASYKILKASKLSSSLGKDVGLEADVKCRGVLKVSPPELGFPPVKQETAVCDLDDASTGSAAPTKKACKKRPSMLPPCRVCGCRASGLHYGVVTCEACNGFFRRSLKRTAIFFCSKENKCDVYGKRRGECSFCRYHRCLAVGMSRTAVKTGR